MIFRPCLNVISPTVNNEYGVPQGSILRALLFIIYINGTLNVLNDCEIILYADDALIYIESDTKNNVMNT